ncbi:MAG: hypothetical protein ABFD60_18115, partial [Bryobacteraceae bacterium]
MTAATVDEGVYRHPSFQPDPRIGAISRDLAAPLHNATIRDPLRIIKEGEADLSNGCSLEIDGKIAGDLAVSIDDFQRFLTVSLGIPKEKASYPLRLRTGTAEGCPAGASEAFHARIEASGGTIIAPDADGLRRALIHLE